MEDTTVEFDDATKEYFSDEKLAILRKLAIEQSSHMKSKNLLGLSTEVELTEDGYTAKIIDEI